MKQNPQILNKKIIAQGDIFKIKKIDLQFANGQTRQYERLHGNPRGGVMIVPLLDNNTILLVREYAAGVERYELSLPKGAIDADETILQAAQRELQEEVGYAAKQLDYLTALTAMPSYLTGTMHIVIAKELYTAPLAGDEPEALDIIPWQLDQLHDLVTRDDVSEARTIAALFLVKDLLHR